MAEQARATRRESAEAWVDEYGDLLYRVAVMRLGDRSAAEDVVQEAFLAAWRSRDSFDGRSDQGTWLVAILKRKIADHYRRVGRSRETTADGEGDELFDHRGIWRRPVSEIDLNPESPVELSEFYRSLQHCVEQLPGSMSSAFRMRECEAESIEQTCEQLGITRQNLAVRLHRARLLLRECLQRTWLGQRESNR